MKQGTKFDKRAIMLKAWKLVRKFAISIAEGLRRAWASAKAATENARRIETQRIMHGISEPIDTWAGWKRAGLQVRHGEHAAFTVELISNSKGVGGSRKVAFFAADQVEAA